MPELPEVETIKRGLQSYLVGHQIEDIQVLDPLRLSGNITHVVGATILSIQRRGKGLIIHLDNDISLAIHVKMTGQLIYVGKKTKQIRLSSKVKELPNPYTRVIFTLSDGAHLYYNDVRRFGWIKVVPKQSVLSLPFFKSLGPEPLSDQYPLTRSYFSSALKKSSRMVKSVLLDQAVIAGVGNIYANDALYLAKIDPRRTAQSLTTEEIDRLYESIHEVLEFSITHGAASNTNYVDALGQEGAYQNHFKVYGKTGEKCMYCNQLIQRIVIGGRGTFLCPSCQN